MSNISNILICSNVSPNMREISARQILKNNFSQNDSNLIIICNFTNFLYHSTVFLRDLGTVSLFLAPAIFASKTQCIETTY